MRNGHAIRNWFLAFALLATLMAPLAMYGSTVSLVSAQEATPPVDTDGDGIPDDTDNCVDIWNYDQADIDENGVGDACDVEIIPTEVPVTDADGDTVEDVADNCPIDANADQSDVDGDTIGDACDLDPYPTPTEMADTDADDDGFEDWNDNCLLIPNDQADENGDGIGDACQEVVFGRLELRTTEDVAPFDLVRNNCFRLVNLADSAIFDEVCDGDSNDWHAFRDGVAVFSRMPVGDYTLTHTYAPDGYTILNGPQTVTISPNQTQLIEMLVHRETDEVTMVDIVVHSLDLDGAPISHGMYMLYQGSQCAKAFGIIDTEADENGVARFPDLEPGTYCVASSSPPPGYGGYYGEGQVAHVAIGDTPTIEFRFADLITSPATPSASPMASNTMPGEDVTVSGLGDGNVSVIFQGITQAGNTTASAILDPAALPEGYTADNALFYDISTTAAYVGDITVCVGYDPSSYLDPSSLVMFHDAGDGWGGLTGYNDWESGLICGITNSLSPFAIAESPVLGSLSIRTENWYRAPVPHLTYIVYDRWECDGASTTVTGDENGIALVENLVTGTHCVADGNNEPLRSVSIEADQVRDWLHIVGDRPANGYIVLELQDEAGVPLTGNQLRSDACISGHDREESGGDRGCDLDDGALDGRIVFGGSPRTVWELSYYIPPFGFEAVSIPAAISGFQPGETIVVPIRNIAIEPPIASLLVNVVDGSGNPFMDACLNVDGDYGGCDSADGNVDGTVFIYGPYTPGDHEMTSTGFRSSGSFQQTITIPAGESLVHVTAVLTPSLVVTAQDENGSGLLYTQFEISGPSFEGTIYVAESSDGSATVYDLAPGDYTVTMLPSYLANLATVRGYETTFTGATVTVGAGAPAELVVPFTRRTSLPSLTVTITDQNGAPMPGACATADGWDDFGDYFERGACADQQGVARFYDLTGSVNVSLSGKVGYSRPATITIDLASQTSVTMVLTELPALPLSGTFHAVTADGMPLVDMCMSIVNEEGSVAESSCDGDDPTPGDGATSLYGIPPGDYWLAVSRYGYEEFRQQITIVEGSPLDMTVTLGIALDNVIDLEVSSVDQAGGILAGACYSLLRPGQQSSLWCDADDGQNDGVTRFWTYNFVIPIGEYLLIETHAPADMLRADAQTILIGGARPMQVSVAHETLSSPNTGVGAGIVVIPEGGSGVTLTFSNVTAAGETTVQAITDGSAPALPTGFSIDGAVYFDISTTAEFNAPVELCLPYNPSAFTNPADARLFHGESGAWEDVTSSNDGLGTICGIVTSFSPFAIAEPVTETPLTIVGFDSPVTMGNGWNTVKGGSTVPLKFEVFRGDEEQTSPEVIAGVALVSVSCSTQAVIGLPADIGGKDLKYSGGKFHQNWKTPKAAGGCYRVTVTTVDGATLDAYFKLK